MKERKDGRREGRGSREGGGERWIDGGEGRDDTRRARGERKGWKERKWNKKRVQGRRMGQEGWIDGKKEGRRR